MTTISSPSFTSSSDPDREECPYLQHYVWRKMYLTEDTYNSLVAVICVTSLTIIPTILLNALVIVVVATRRRLRTNSNILLACLAGTDLLAGLVAQPIAIAVEVKRAFSVGPFCTLEKVHAVALMGVGSASLSHLVLISIDRYIAIKDALRYRDIVTKQWIKKGVLVAWAIAMFVTIEHIILSLIDSETNIYSVYVQVADILMAIIGSLFIAVMSYIYGYIFVETRRQKKRLQTEQLSHEEAKSVNKDNKAANTLAIILGALILTYLPTVILLLVENSSDRTVNPRVRFVPWTFVLLGSLVNPVIYCWRNKKLRRAFLEIFHVRQPENRAPDIEMVEIRRHRPDIQPITCEAFSMAALNNEPILLSFSNLGAEEIVHIEETDS